MRSKLAIERALARAGITIGGPNDWDIHVRDARFFDRILAEGTLGVGESYMDGWWECARIDELVARVFEHEIEQELLRSPLAVARAMVLRAGNRQRWLRSRKVARVHYDLGNAFFERMLGPSMTYSCAYFRAAADLDEAQAHKHDLVCAKLGIEARDRVLDIGCGWGSFAAHAARKTGCRVTGITNSAQQAAYGRAACAGLPVDIMLADYRSPRVARLGPFDKIVSVGMFEHVGRRNYRRFMRLAHDLLAEGGLLLLHTIGNHPGPGVDPWVDKYIFPNSMVPCAADIAAAFGPYFVLEDWHSFGSDYDRTLMAWHGNFARHARSDDFPFDARFTRMWRFYLLSFAGAFWARNAHQLWQIVLSKKGVPGGYRSIR